MDTLLDLFAALNASVDAGMMTQETLKVAIVAIIRKAHAEHERGVVPLSWLLRLSREMYELKRNWEARQPRH